MIATMIDTATVTISNGWNRPQGFIPAAFIIVGWPYFWCSAVDAPGTKTFGALLLFACISTFLSMAIPPAALHGVASNSGGGMLGQALAALNPDMMARHSDYVCRVTADEDVVGRVHLDHIQDLESDTPVILTTSQMLSTGVDMPTCRNIVLARVVGSTQAASRSKSSDQPRASYTQTLPQGSLPDSKRAM